MLQSDGVTDLIALRSFIDLNSGSVGVNKVIVRRAINPAGSSLPAMRLTAQPGGAGGV